uniref:Uncharacterized protein n=1 Tax=Anopheles merus TaxID=30066 RepID=A0A182VMA9_ANOME
MREDDDECFTEVESEPELGSLSAMRSGFKALYDELDRLGEQATLTVESIEQERAGEKEVLNNEDIADLIRYARTFIRETRKTFVTVDEHGVQCGPERRSNKKVSTPKAWKQPIVAERTVEREVLTVCENRRRSAVTVIQQTVPRDDAGAVSDDPEGGGVMMSTAGERSIQTEPLNNTVAVETLPEFKLLFDRFIQMQSEKYPDAAKDHAEHLENVVTEQVEQAEQPPQEPDSVEPALVKRKEYSTKNRPEVSLDIFDEESTCSSTEGDLEEDDIRVLLNWKDDRSSETTDSVYREAEREKTLPTSVQCQRSLLEVSSIPALRSPAELSQAAVDGTSESDHDPTFSGQSSSRFLDNLRIWKSAVDMQSRNMKMSNELAEDLAALKDNLQKIAEESAKVVKMAHNVKSCASKVEESYPAQCVPVRPASSASSARRSKSCECFGCQHTFEERPPSSRPAFSSPLYDYKKFQRTVFESNPRYAKTIRKICEFGGRERTQSARLERDESVRKAAQKFLQSLQGNTIITERSCCSSRSSPVLLRSPSKSVSSRSDGLVGTVDYGGPVISENEYGTDSEVVSVCSSSTCDTPFSGDTNSNGSSAGQIGTSEGMDLSSLTSNFHAQCDLGEVLSPGEIK